jgi:hypothetical protein
MEHKRQQAYRYLLYQFLLDIRTAPAAPEKWPQPEQQAYVAYAGSLAYLLHNLALAAATSFEGFDEARFWQALAAFNERNPAIAATHLQPLFEAQLRAE